VGGFFLNFICGKLKIQSNTAFNRCCRSVFYLKHVMAVDHCDFSPGA